MNEFFNVVLTGLLAFVSAHYTLTVAQVKDPVKIIVATVFALLLVLAAGVLLLTEVIDL